MDNITDYDKAFADFCKFNGNTLRKEFAEGMNCDPNDVSDFYPDEFAEFCRNEFRSEDVT